MAEENGLAVGRQQFVPWSHSVYFIYTPSAFVTHFKYNVLKWKLSIHCVIFILEMAELGWDSDTRRFAFVLQLASSTVGTNQNSVTVERNSTVISSFLLQKIQFGNKQPVLPHTVTLACVYAVWRFNNIIHHEEATFMQSSCSLPYPQQPVINLCLESNEFSLHLHLLFL